VVKSDLPLAFEATKIQSPCFRATFDHFCCAIDDSCVPRERDSPSWFNSSHWFNSRGLEAATPGASEFKYVQGMQANPTEGFQGGEDAETETTHAHKRHTHTLHRNDTRTLFTETTHAYVHAPTPACAHMCMHASLHARTYMHANLCAQMHTQTNTYVRKGTCMRGCANLSTHTNVYAHARTHACLQP